jgi:N-dimethylarginine dimethylaminohydrolase
VLLLELVNEKCYHLDTSLCILDNDSALVYPHAFSSDGIGMIRALFKNIVEVADEDADNFAGNAVVLGKHVILQRGSNKTCDRLRAAGFTPIEVDTGEFMKSGGSVFCMKMMVY